MGNEHSKTGRSGSGSTRPGTAPQGGSNIYNPSGGNFSSGVNSKNKSGSSPSSAVPPPTLSSSQPRLSPNKTYANSPSSSRVSVPQVLNPQSFVYPQPTDNDGAGGEDEHFNSFSHFVGVSSTTDPFIVGTPSSPLASSTRRIHAPPQLQAPIYNMSGSADDIASVSSPVLRSYREHSFTKAELLKSPAGRGPSFGGPLGTEMSVDQSALMGSSINYGVSPNMGTANSSMTSNPPLHARFLEITGAPLGLENYGNTCYLNSVIQLLYHCAPIRLRLLELQEVYASRRGGVGFEETTVLFQLCQLFTTMHKQNNPALNVNGSKKHHTLGSGSSTSDHASPTSGGPMRKPKVSPSSFLKCIKENNASFNNSMQQDAHEFVLYLLNDIIETEQKMMTDPRNRELFSDAANYRKKKTSFSSLWKSGSSSSKGPKKGETRPSADAPPVGGSSGSAPMVSPLQAIIQGSYESVTACLECNHMTAREEVFLDISVETNPGCSLNSCISHIGDPEYFFGDNKLLHCDGCGVNKFRAAKTIHVERLPQYALLIHLKRFRYDASKNMFSKQSHHVALPIEMDVEEYEPVVEGDDEVDAALKEKAKWNQEHNVPNDSFKKAPEHVKRKLHGLAKHKARFELAGFVAHLGEGPSSGHYFTCVRYGPQKWRRLDDENVTDMTEREVQQHFGVPIQVPGLVTSTAYILLYERVA